jgi:hypothetical protein
MLSSGTAGGQLSAQTCSIKEMKNVNSVRKKMQMRWLRVKILSGSVAKITLLFMRGNGFKKKPIYSWVN